MINFIVQYGYWALALTTFVDHTGTPAPLLLATGLAASGVLDIKYVILVAFAGSYLGDCLGFLIGKYGGKPFFSRYGSRIYLNNTRIQAAEEFFRRYGFSVMVWGRFLAIVSRFIPFAAGTLNMGVWKFLGLSAIGNLLLNLLYGILGYLFGEKLNEYFQNPWLSVYITIGIVVFQLLLSWLWLSWRFKQKR